MKYQDFNFSALSETQSFTINHNTINVKKYLSTSEKFDLITVTLQKSKIEDVYNELLLDMYFHLNIIYLYTDIDFTLEDRENEFELYDILETNGIIDKVVSIIGTEYEDLKTILEQTKQNNLNYQNTAAAVIRKFIDDLPANAAAAKEIVDSFDPAQYQSVIDFAAAANGGRPINQQTAPVATAASTQSESIAPPTRKIVNIQKTSKQD